MDKNVEDLLSGEQIIRDDGRWDRVHGVNTEDYPGSVVVNSDSNSREYFEPGSSVRVV